MENLEYQIDPR